MKIIQSKLLSNFKNISHCFTTKDAGNLAFHVGDDIVHVQKNHELLASALNYKKYSLIHMKQIHSSLTHVVSENDNFDKPQSCDALVTNKKNIPLMVMVADCSPILFYNTQKEVIAVAHAGRQGAFKNIIQNVIDTMKSEFNSDVNNLHVSVGASIGVCCYEVGEEIYTEAKSLHVEYAVDIRDNSYFLDIGKILKKQLLKAGLKKENIEISQECTCCLSNKYFSYRAEGITGRFSGLLMLK